MKAKKSPKLTQQDKDWQKKIEKSVKSEKLELGHPRGKERLEKAIKQIFRGKK